MAVMLRWVSCIGLVWAIGLGAIWGESLPETDQRARRYQDLNTPRQFPDIDTRADWRAHARELREHIRISCGLRPMPEKTDLNAEIFGRMERDGYSVEKVYFQTYPGVYLSGNLYRPLGRGDGPFPAVLNPHGHWGEGRLVDNERGSVQARCIQFARHGLVAFAYDMVGYNDTIQVDHEFARDPIHQLWSISLMGLQTWNSVRALDFLAGLPDTDPERLACTGASGGGTQTFMLGAIDDRLAVQAPNVMVSHIMQGGCLCENAPGLRIDHSNMEIAAQPAPRPQILVSATGDWTRHTPSVEGPAIEGVYRLFGATDQLRYVRFNFDHNYNQTSREAVYEWFGLWLLPEPDPKIGREQPYDRLSASDLRVWPEGNLPGNARTEEELIAYLVGKSKQQWRDSQPDDETTLRRYQEQWQPVWRHLFQVDYPVEELLVETEPRREQGPYSVQPVAYGRAGKGDRLPGQWLAPVDSSARAAVVLVHPQGKRAFLDASGEPVGLAKDLVKQNYAVLLIDTFLTGALADASAEHRRRVGENYFSTYNRTDLQQRVQDLIGACALARQQLPGEPVWLWGTGRAGLWALAAAPAADGVVADAHRFNSDREESYLASDLFVPGLLKMGSFQGVAMLSAPNPLYVYDCGSNFPTENLDQVYESIGAGRRLHSESGSPDYDQLIGWITEQSGD
jgi:dienelactone hydrolase